MGGNAITIAGTVDLKRIVGSKNPKEVSMGKTTLIELPSKEFSNIGTAFKDHLRRVLKNPWQPTSAILAYYLDTALKVYVRGQRDSRGATAWTVQMGFSGCAGEAQISSDVSAHWARRWYLQEPEAVAQILRPLGFSPLGLDAEDVAAPLFLPVGSFGYASFREGGWSEAPGPPTIHFAIDSSAREFDPEAATEFMAALDANFSTLMSDGRCRCQLCFPDFEVQTLSGLPHLS